MIELTEQENPEPKPTSKEAASQTRSSSRWRFWTVAAVGTLALAIPTASRLTTLRKATAALRDEQTFSAHQQEEANRLEQLGVEAEAQKQRANALEQETQAALRSFSRPELQTALANAFETAQPRDAMFATHNVGGWGRATFVWMPEAGHAIEVLIQPENILSRHLFDPDNTFLESPTIRIPLAPNRLHSIVVEVDQNYKEKNFTLRVVANGSVRFEAQLKLNPGSSSHPGMNQDLFVPPGFATSDYVMMSKLGERMGRRAWKAVDKFRLGFSDPAVDSQEKQDAKQEKKAIRIGIQVDVVSDGPIYVAPFHKNKLAEAAIPFKEVTDKASPFYGKLRIPPRQRQERRLPPLETL